MSSHPTRDIVAALQKKGFVEGNNHHRMFIYMVDGKKSSIRTRISHGEKEYGDSLLGQMARQMGLSRSDLDLFIECPLAAEEYKARMLEAGLLKL